MQAAVQTYIDSSISKTINCPEGISFDAFKDVYLQAYELGCKGCTTYRPNEITGAVLEVKGTGRRGKEAAQPELPLPAPATAARPKDLGDSGAIVQMFRPLDRPEALPGKTYKVRWPESDHAIYITLNDIVQDGRRRPFEVFINSKNMEHYAWTVALTRMISAVFRRGGDVSFVVEELKAVFDPRGGQWMRGRYVPSLLAAIGEVIETHMIDIGFLPPPGQSQVPAAEPARQVVGLGHDPRFRQCPKCGAPSLIRQEDCDTCTGCGYSKSASASRARSFASAAAGLRPEHVGTFDQQEIRGRQQVPGDERLGGLQVVLFDDPLESDARVDDDRHAFRLPRSSQEVRPGPGPGGDRRGWRDWPIGRYAAARQPGGASPPPDPIRRPRLGPGAPPLPSTFPRRPPARNARRTASSMLRTSICPIARE